MCIIVSLFFEDEAKEELTRAAYLQMCCNAVLQAVCRRRKLLCMSGLTVSCG